LLIAKKSYKIGLNYFKLTLISAYKFYKFGARFVVTINVKAKMQIMWLKEKSLFQRDFKTVLFGVSFQKTEVRSLANNTVGGVLLKQYSDTPSVVVEKQ